MFDAFLSSRRYLQQRRQVVLPERRSGRREWIMARSLCHYRCFDLSGVPTAKRDETLALQIRQWSPFSDFAEYSVWHKGRAQVWVWEQTGQRQTQAGHAVKQARLMPESVLRPALAEGVQMLRCSEGYEAQVWDKNCLLASRWWPELPDAQAWQAFLRGHRLALDTAQPAPVDNALLAQPWGRARRALSGFNQVRNEGLWLTTAVAVLLSLLAWQGVAIEKQQQALDAVNAEIESLSAAAGPILQARNQALADQEAGQRLLALNPYPSQLNLMAKIAELLPSPEAGLKEWLYQNGDLRFTVTAPAIDPRQYVQALQSQSLFHDIETESGRSDKELIIHLRVAAGQ